jgi:hypothetical protein
MTLEKKQLLYQNSLNIINRVKERADFILLPLGALVSLFASKHIPSGCRNSCLHLHNIYDPQRIVSLKLE